MRFEEEKQEGKASKERPDSWWFRIYLVVIFYTALIISLLALFSGYFSH